jgi:hypothetical protein
LARAAAATENDPTEEGEIFPPGEDVIAVAAVGARRDDALFLWKSGQEDVEEAAKGEAEEGREEGACELEWVGDL